MKIRKAAAIYSVSLGAILAGMWAMFYMTGRIPELETRPAEITLHIAAEMITAILLISGGTGLLLSRKWAFKTYMFSMGMLFYTLIVSPGYYIQRKEPVFIVMFSVVFAVSAVFLILMMKIEPAG